MRVKFLTDYSGTLTNETEHKAGELADLSADTANALMLAGVAVRMEEAAPPVETPKPAKKAKP